MAKFKIEHITRYTYEVPVRDSANQIMLYPIEDDHQDIILHKLKITGSPEVDIHNDIFGNKVGTFTHSQSHQELVIDSKIEVMTRPRPLPEDTTPKEEQWQALQKIKNQIPYIDFLKLEALSDMSEIQRIVEAVKPQLNTPLASAQSLCTFVFENFAYKKGITTVETTLDEILKIRSGVCQDFAHVLLALLRIIDIPARYVSGYICPNKNGMRGEGATHAWVEAYIPFYGWLGLDPTNNCIANENHVRLAFGKSFSDCSPVKGTYRGTSNHTLEVSVTVSYEDGQTAGATSAGPDAGGGGTVSISKNSYRRHQEIQMQQ